MNAVRYCSHQGYLTSRTTFPTEGAQEGKYTGCTRLQRLGALACLDERAAGFDVACRSAQVDGAEALEPVW
jgi:hypothetical protein